MIIHQCITELHPAAEPPQVEVSTDLFVLTKSLDWAICRYNPATSLFSQRYITVGGRSDYSLNVPILYWGYLPPIPVSFSTKRDGDELPQPAV